MPESTVNPMLILDQGNDIIARKIAQFEEHFFAQCDLQLTKVNTFFAGMFKSSLFFV